MELTRRLLDYYLPPGEGFVLESLVATTYQVDFEFLEEELLAAALGVRSPVSRVRAFLSELERRLQKAEVSVLYDLGGSERLARLSPRIDAIPIAARKLHSKLSLLMWVREGAGNGPAPERRVRLIVGSANLTRQGFRQNYECVAAADFGGRSPPPRSLLLKAVAIVRRIGSESSAPQLVRQVAAFAGYAAGIAEGTASPDDPVALVAAEEVVPTVTDTWAALSDEPPERVVVVSPFWAEGTTAPEALTSLLRRLGDPARVELVCRGERSGDGKAWLPVFDASLAVGLKAGIKGRLFLCATRPDAGLMTATTEAGDESEEADFAAQLGMCRDKVEEVQRALHAKVILLQGRRGDVLYAGSSNCTRRGLGLGGPTNHEAGFVYQLSPRQRKHVIGLLEFAGPPTEVLADAPPATVQPPTEEEATVPTFLAEVVVAGTLVTIRFREPAPGDLVLLMPVPTMAGEAGCWALYQAGNGGAGPDQPVEVDLATCPLMRRRPAPPPRRTARPADRATRVHRGPLGGEHSATFPVRFDDKARLPLTTLLGAKANRREN